LGDPPSDALDKCLRCRIAADRHLLFHLLETRQPELRFLRGPEQNQLPAARFANRRATPN
jgi:hypothetical protein